MQWLICCLCEKGWDWINEAGWKRERALHGSVSQGIRSWEGGWDLRTGVKGRRSSWTGGSEEPLFSASVLLSSKAFPGAMQNPGGSLEGKFTGLSRKAKDLEVSPKLKASSMVKGW